MLRKNTDDKWSYVVYIEVQSMSLHRAALSELPILFRPPSFEVKRTSIYTRAIIYHG